ncbi:hypothetical protein SLEP1_g11495 [Rubroshorea leprosula]|uniref:Uncharacterized protein n=1 Tax=Rubroshorea leprosula TaxID=152421 RepID=A0AAV5IK06_9ROSI|nr:hypothetical protein SLEP1_g11495 [Rubroshorea leprosula]
MSSPSTQLTTTTIGVYEPFHQLSRWGIGDTFKSDDSPNTGSSTVVQADARLENQSEYISCEPVQYSRSDQEADKSSEKMLRRLAQNREAARKSRLRKKAYVQQLESSRLKLTQLEQEVDRARQQISKCLNAGSTHRQSRYWLFGTVFNCKFGVSLGILHSLILLSSDYVLVFTLHYCKLKFVGITTFEMEYAHWVEEQSRQICELRNALQVHITDIELRILVENGLKHYYNLFRMKENAAKADVFYLISGIWRTSTERFFHWIGGFRPSELLNAVVPQLEPLTEKQLGEVSNLRQSSQQAEDALSQGIEKLQQTLAQTLAAHPVGFRSQMAAAVDKLDALESFVNQADHLRQQTLQQMSRILTIRQTARGLLALGEYFHRLRALSSLWAARPREPAWPVR